MPARGYRKGVSDNKAPTRRSVRTHVTDSEFAGLALEAELRRLTLSKLVRELVSAHLTGQRLRLPHPRRADARLLYEWNRLGNTLNQIARQAHLMRLHHLEHDTRACLAAIRTLVERSP